MSNYHRIYIPPGKKHDDITRLIRGLHEKVALKCKKYEEQFNKKYAKFYATQMKVLNKTMKSKEHKAYKAKTDAISSEFNNSEVFKEYVKNINKNSNSQLMDKKFLKKYKALKNKYLKALASALKDYNNTPMYQKYKAKVKAIHRLAQKTREARNIIHCAFKHCRGDYAVIIKLLLKNIKADKRNLRVYNYLKKINTKKITITEYKKITYIFNRITGRTFNYID
jgi:hypothetical protein